MTIEQISGFMAAHWSFVLLVCVALFAVIVFAYTARKLDTMTKREQERRESRFDLSEPIYKHDASMSTYMILGFGSMTKKTGDE
jgi:hypothetical protein